MTTERAKKEKAAGEASSVHKHGNGGTVAAHLQQPIPLLGRRAQHLGYVHKLMLSLPDRSIRQVELTTPWQTLQLHGATVLFDERRGVFRLQRMNRARGREAHHPSDP